MSPRPLKNSPSARARGPVANAVRRQAEPSTLLPGSGHRPIALTATFPPPATLVDAFLRKPSGVPLRAAPAAARAIPVRGSGREWTSDDLATLKRLIREQGYSNTALALHFHTSSGNVANALYRYGLTRRLIKAAAP